MSDTLRQELLEIFVGRATRRYGLSDVNQLQHALQAAALAEADGASPATVLASLLHDVGHMIHQLGEDPAARGVDDVHEELGAKWLAQRFGPEVSEPVRLHVAAKRYLCTVEADYFSKLAPDSVRSLELQGGLMSPDEVDDFRALPHHAEAVRLRRYDEGAKDPQASTADFDHFLRHVEACRLQ
ncbi:phosphonate degradation operons associated HDIG domain protein [Enhydrobacter aerosaccus]|uniref:Phosphonate degradation operons associated HDIG domain protein n=1 Tax=Enhydrobacter aerosaccus TaxID=225324 RepID=A0A1T4QE09_9HYPH|nr:HD domain-containing protein [Enhydrobacter aerosaccus]SKA01979.1 phosphonate degradation operons associated HDIG domain protein [Enhydrobacter aerosaccus]